jgi:hypothetical protein
MRQEYGGRFAVFESNSVAFYADLLRSLRTESKYIFPSRNCVKLRLFLKELNLNVFFPRERRLARRRRRLAKAWGDKGKCSRRVTVNSPAAAARPAVLSFARTLPYSSHIRGARDTLAAVTYVSVE